MYIIYIQAYVKNLNISRIILIRYCHIEKLRMPFFLILQLKVTQVKIALSQFFHHNGTLNILIAKLKYM